MEETYIFKVVIGGQGAVGKTTLLHRYLNGTFLQNSAMTIGVAFHTKQINLDSLQKKVKIALWDLGGQERFRFLQANYSAGAKAAVVFFDMTRIGTIMQVKDWVKMFRSHATEDVPIVLGGTKLDLVTPDELEDINHLARETASELDLDCYVPTSSKNGENVDAIFQYITDTLIVQSQDARATAPEATQSVPSS
ncbi:MAG: GTP-binding protein [Candidatus Lokiarchaeota archaeon]|nr:GTP-binding protein [Candidatus Lokiarchaeota archaeon]